MSRTPDYYEVLQVPSNAEPGIIHAAYRRLAFKCHPDVNPGDGTARDRMNLLNEAYSILSDSESRKKYDFARCRESGSGASDIKPSPFDFAQFHRKASEGVQSLRPCRQARKFKLASVVVLILFISLFRVLIENKQFTNLIMQRLYPGRPVSGPSPQSLPKVSPRSTLSRSLPHGLLDHLGCGTQPRLLPTSLRHVGELQGKSDFNSNKDIKELRGT